MLCGTLVERHECRPFIPEVRTALDGSNHSPGWYAGARNSMANTGASSAQQSQGLKLLAVVEGEAQKLPPRLPPLLFAGISAFFVVEALRALNVSLWWSLAWLPIIVIVERLLNGTAREYQHRLIARIDRSAVLEKLILGSSDLDEIYAWTPWPWSIVFLGFRPKRLNGWVKLVALNIEWYLREPRRYFRLRWAVLAIASVYLVTYIVFPLAYSPALPYANLATACVSGWVLSLLAMFVTLEQSNQRAAIVAMHQLLRLRFIEDLE